MVKKAILLLSAAACLFGNVQAQSQSGINCQTDEKYAELKKEHPEIAVYEQQLKNQIDRQLMGLDIRKFAKTTYNFDTMYHIPLVFHVIHNFGSEYVSDDYIYAIVKQLNKMYLKQNADTVDIITPYKFNIHGTNVKYAARSNIQWHLATKDPEGNPTHGITRHRHYLATEGGDQAKFDLWPPDSYVNIWLINKFGAANAGAGAYAYGPTAAAAFPIMYYDGVIGLASQAGDNGTISHELGHSLSLAHPWGSASGLNGNLPPCGDDDVDDTPPTHGHTQGGGCSAANLYDTGCIPQPGGYFKVYDSTKMSQYFNVTLANGSTTFTVNYPDTVNSQNIMDYTFCDKMFTHLQVLRMRATLNSSTAGRNHLITAINLATTGALAPWPDLAPIPNFSLGKYQTTLSDKINSDKVYACADQIFSFTDRSWNDTVTARKWTFDHGASTPTSTASSVATSFTQPGWVKIDLEATGNNSGTGTKSWTNAVYAADPNATNPIGYYMEFNADAETEKWPTFNYFDNNWKWTRATNAGYFDQTSMKYTGFDARTGYPERLTGTPKGDYDDFFSPVFNTSVSELSGNANLNFMSAGACRSTNNADIVDTMEILYSTDCGTKWNWLTTLSKNTLANNGAFSGDFTPTHMGQWKMQSIPLPAAAKAAKVMFRFRYRPGVFVTNGSQLGSGNNFYMDRVTISPWPAGVDADVFQATGIALIPNPTHDGANMIIKGGSGNAHIMVTDLAGKTVYTTDAELKGDMTKVEIPAAAVSVKGMYLVHLVSGGNTRTEKLVVY